MKSVEIIRSVLKCIGNIIGNIFFGIFGFVLFLIGVIGWIYENCFQRQKYS